MALIKVCPSSFEHHADRSIEFGFLSTLGYSLAMEEFVVQ